MSKQMISPALTPEMERRGFRLSLSAEQGSFPGKPHRAALSITARRSRGERYNGADCPFCHGPLFEAPQCVGRSVSEAEPHQMYVLDQLPSENVAVVCMECELAFFPLREALQALSLVGVGIE